MQMLPVGVIQAFPVPRVHSFIKISCMKMVARLLEMVTGYENRLRTMQHVPGFSYGRPMLRDVGCPNKFFFMYLFCEYGNINDTMTLLKQINKPSILLPYEHMYIQIFIVTMNSFPSSIRANTIPCLNSSSTHTARPITA